MALWNRELHWWELVNRSAVIRSAADFAADGGILVLTGPAGFGHMEGAKLAVRQIVRYGWACHDLTTDAPQDAARLIISGVESIFPTAPNGVPQVAQLAGLGTSVLAHHVRDLCDGLLAKHCLVAAYADDNEPMARSDVDFLKSITRDAPLCLLLTSTAVSRWQDFPEIPIVELDAFRVEHVRNCLVRGSHTEGFAVDNLENLQAALEELALADGRIVPQAAYTWLRQHGITP